MYPDAPRHVRFEIRAHDIAELDAPAVDLAGETRAACATVSGRFI